MLNSENSLNIYELHQTLRADYQVFASTKTPAWIDSRALYNAFVGKKAKISRLPFVQQTGTNLERTRTFFLRARSAEIDEKASVVARLAYNK